MKTLYVSDLDGTLLRSDHIIGSFVTVTVDRPMGSIHPKHHDIFYPINYGYVEGVKAADGEWQDVYILGVNEPVKSFSGKVVAVIHRLDDVEDKWVVCPENVSFSKKEIIFIMTENGRICPK